MGIKNDIIVRVNYHPQDFNDKEPSSNHEKRFYIKLIKRFKHFISIVPHLLKLFVITIIVFISSILIWNEYIRKDRHEITLKEKIINIVTVK